MTGDDLTSALLEGAVPPIPVWLAHPPLARIRRRARHRQLAVAGSAAALVLVLVVAGTAAVDRWPSSAPAGVGTQPVSPEPSTSDSSGPGVVGPVPWQVVRVDRAGTGLTVYVEPPAGQCRVYRQFVATLDQSADAVDIGITAAPGTGADCSRSFVSTALPVRLAAPLGTRPVRDHGTTRPAFLDRELPLVPAPWIEIPEDYGSFDGSRWDVGYSGPDGTDLRIQAMPGTVTETPVRPVTLGHRTGVTFHDGLRVGVQWAVGSLVYTMTVIASEGTEATMDQLDHLLSELSWSQ